MTTSLWGFGLKNRRIRLTNSSGYILLQNFVANCTQKSVEYKIYEGFLDSKFDLYSACPYLA
jgi:hypothetical protein